MCLNQNTPNFGTNANFLKSITCGFKYYTNYSTYGLHPMQCWYFLSIIIILFFYFFNQLIFYFIVNFFLIKTSHQLWFFNIV